jgi:hypothetical protein
MKTADVSRKKEKWKLAISLICTRQARFPPLPVGTQPSGCGASASRNWQKQGMARASISNWMSPTSPNPTTPHFLIDTQWPLASTVFAPDQGSFAVITVSSYSLEPILYPDTLGPPKLVLKPSRREPELHRKRCPNPRWPCPEPRYRLSLPLVVFVPNSIQSFLDTYVVLMSEVPSLPFLSGCAKSPIGRQ